MFIPALLLCCLAFTSPQRINVNTSSVCFRQVGPLINGNSYYFFSATQRSGAGSITGVAGSVVTVTVAASGPPPSTYSTSFSCSVTLSNGTSSLSASNTSNSATFVMPASGSISWSGSFSEPNDDGSGSVSVR
jgi:hypothetical protein